MDALEYKTHSMDHLEFFINCVVFVQILVSSRFEFGHFEHFGAHTYSVVRKRNVLNNCFCLFIIIIYQYHKKQIFLKLPF